MASGCIPPARQSLLSRAGRLRRTTRPFAFKKFLLEALLYPAKWLLDRRDLHTDMLRESNRRSDSHIARYQMAREASPFQGRVLGCGMGYGAQVLGFGRPDLSVLGVDMDKDAIEYCNANFSA